MDNIGENIRRLRKSANLTQNALSKSINVKQSTVSRWENGVDNPSMGYVPALAKLLNCTTDDLLGYGPAQDLDELQLVANYRKLNDQDRIILIDISTAMAGK